MEIRAIRICLGFLLPLSFWQSAMAQPSLDQIATDYVKLVLRVAQHDENYLDAYYGPADWKREAAAEPGTIATLKAEAARLLASVGAMSSAQQAEERSRFLKSQLTAVAAKIAILSGADYRYEEEARALYGIRPDFQPLDSYAGALMRIEALVPGIGSLPERVTALRTRFAVPKDRLEAVMRASIGECRRRSQAHLSLPFGESFELQMVSEKPWAAYNWYKGAFHSLIQLNTDFPLTVERVLELACHEGYPGHHTHSSLLEQVLVRGRKWVEYSIYPIESPFFFIAEGISNYVPELVFPLAERLKFLREELLPLAGLPEQGVEELVALGRAMDELSAATMTITADYLDGRIDRTTAIELIARYALLTEAQAAQSVDLMPHFGSYGVNYGLGEQMVRHYIQAAGPDSASRWRALETLLSKPRIPADLNVIPHPEK